MTKRCGMQNASHVNKTFCCDAVEGKLRVNVQRTIDDIILGEINLLRYVILGGIDCSGEL
jgi:hypothetical protein